MMHFTKASLGTEAPPLDLPMATSGCRLSWGHLYSAVMHWGLEAAAVKEYEGPRFRVAALLLGYLGSSM